MVAGIFKSYAAAAGLDPTEFSGHSLRRGPRLPRQLTPEPTRGDIQRRVAAPAIDDDHHGPSAASLLQLQFNKLDPAVADIPQGASDICILPEEIRSLQVYLAIALIWRTFCQDSAAYDDADTRRLLCDCGNGLARIERQSPLANAIIDLHFVVFESGRPAVCGGSASQKLT